MDHPKDRSEFVFFNVGTIHSTSVIVEFGAILICPKTLAELRKPYFTVVRPTNPFLITVVERSNGFDPDVLADAPTFADIADRVFELLHDRIWVGHNILEFDCVHIRKAFGEMNWPPPEAKAVIDSLPLLTKTFGCRAADMEMASLATYFGLGQKKHGIILRCLNDVRMNLEVLKHCATVLFLESSLPNILAVDSWASPSATPRSRSSGKSLTDKGLSDVKVKSLVSSPFENQCKMGNDPTSPTESNTKIDTINTVHRQRHFDLRPLADVLNKSVMVDEKPIIPETPRKCSSSSSAASVSDATLNPDEILISCLTASLVPLYRGSQRVQVLHTGVPFQLSCTDLKIRFGINGKFQDYAGLPKLSFVVDLDPSQTLCKVLEDCDKKAKSLCLESGSSSEWRPVVTEYGFFNYPTVRLQIPRAESGTNAAIYATEIYERKSSAGTVKRVVFDKFDVEEIGSLFKAGTFVDAVLSLESYDYRQNAGIRLISKRLTILSK